MSWRHAVIIVGSVAAVLGIGYADYKDQVVPVFPPGSFVTAKLTGIKGQVLSANPPCYEVRFLTPFGGAKLHFMTTVLEPCVREFELYKAEER